MSSRPRPAHLPAATSDQRAPGNPPPIASRQTAGRAGAGPRRRRRPAPAGSRRPRCWRAGRPSPPPARAAVPSLLATASMIRRLAWCGTSQSTSAASKPAGASTSSAALGQLGRPRGGTPRGRSSAGGRRCRSRTGRRRRRGCPSGGRRRSRWVARTPRSRVVPVPLLGRAARPRPRRRRTARRSRGPPSRGCARRSRRRSPARVAPGRSRIMLSADRQRVDEAGADGLEVEGRRPRGMPSLRCTAIAVAGKV